MLYDKKCNDKMFSFSVKGLSRKRAPSYKVLFTTIIETISTLIDSKTNITPQLEMRHYTSSNLLILDKVGFKRLNLHKV